MNGLLPPLAIFLDPSDYGFGCLQPDNNVATSITAKLDFHSLTEAATRSVADLATNWGRA